MKNAMKKTLCLVLVLLMAVPLMVFSASAATTYDEAEDGELLYTANFNGDDRWDPSTEAAIENAGWNWVESATLVATPDEQDSGKITFTKETQVNSAWGGDVEGLPLGEGYAYTVKFTVIRTSNKPIGLLFDGHFGAYVTVEKGRLQRNGNKLEGHDFISFASNPLVTVPGSEVVSAEKPSVQEFAIAVNGDENTFALYVKEEGGKWFFLDEGTPEARDEGKFTRDSIGLYFYSFSKTEVTVSDVKVYKGDSLVESEGLWIAPAGSDDVGAENNGDEEATTAPKPQKAPPILVEDKTEATGSDDSADEKKGCGATVGVAGGAMILVSALGMCKISFRRKENE